MVAPGYVALPYYFLLGVATPTRMANLGHAGNLETELLPSAQSIGPRRVLTLLL